MKMKKIILVLLVLATCFPTVSGAKKQKKKETPTEKVNSDRTYPKLFKDATKLIKAKSLDLSIYLYNEKVYLEIPRRNFGREFLFTSSITKATDLGLQGVMPNHPKCLIIDKQDSLVYFKQPRANYAVNPRDTALAKALDISKVDAITNAFRVAAYNVDSSRVVIDVTSFLKTTNKHLFSLKGLFYEEGVSIQSSTQKGDEYVESINAYQNCVCLTKSLSLELELGSMFGVLNEKPVTSLSVQIMISILPEKLLMMPTKEANAHIGSGYVTYTDYRDLADVKTGYHATRRRLYAGNKVVFYVDTLISDSWRNAIHDAAERWNDEFEKLNMGRPLTISPFSADSTFNANDPMVNAISFANNLSRYVTSYNVTDPRTGEIFSTKISVPRDLAANVRRNGMSIMAEVDDRYRTYYLPDDLLCEILKAYMLKSFGSSLGLSQNLAGSYAYSPQQLRSATFTQKNGITASVMDNVIYNFVAMPGDREKGVVLTLNKPGKADAFALRYLYGNDSKKGMDQLIASNSGNPEYRAGKPGITYSVDPRCLTHDLSNDPIESTKAKLHHLRYLAKHADKWFNMNELPSSFQLFPEMSILETVNCINTLKSFIGGVYQNEPIPGRTNILTVPVPKLLQRKCMSTLFEMLANIEWYDTNPEFSRLGGANSNVNYVYHAQGYLLRTIFPRLKYMDMSIDHSNDPYTQHDFLTDMERHVFNNVWTNKAPGRLDIIDMSMYVSTLIGYSRNMTAIANSKKGDHNAFAGDALVPVSGVEPTTELFFYHRTDLEPLLYQKLTDARNLLVRAKRLCRNTNDANKIQFIIMIADRVLKK